MKKRIILASASPQRQRLLSLLIPEFEVIPANTDESLQSRSPKKETARLSRLKASAVAAASGYSPEALIIAADTLVYAHGQLLGKPRSRQEASDMIDLLNGHPHHVVTGLSLLCAGRQIVRTFSTKIWMETLSDEWKEHYLNTNEWQGAAGGYRIQDSGEWLFTKMKGSYSNVVGLPMAQLRRLILRYFPEFLLPLSEKQPDSRGVSPVSKILPD